MLDEMILSYPDFKAIAGIKKLVWQMLETQDRYRIWGYDTPTKYCTSIYRVGPQFAGIDYAAEQVNCADFETNYKATCNRRNNSKLAYSASKVALTPVAGATDIFTLTGSATKMIGVTRVFVSGGSPAAVGVLDISLIRRSSPNSGGASTPVVAVPHRSSNPPATAAARAYTANPATGAIVGVVYTRTVSIPKAGVSTDTDFYTYNGVTQPITLSGAADVLAINLNEATIAGGTISCSIEWYEE